jgi:hypothetical protein
VSRGDAKVPSTSLRRADDLHSFRRCGATDELSPGPLDLR